MTWFTVVAAVFGVAVVVVLVLDVVRPHTRGVDRRALRANQADRSNYLQHLPTWLVPRQGDGREDRR